MSLYQASPINKNVLQATAGEPTYLLGSLNRLTQATKMNISTVALSGTTATVTGTVIEGNIPVVGQLVSLSGAVPSYFNVTNAKILSVSAPASPDVGVYTITFALTNSNIGTTNSPGVALAPQIETPELFSNLSVGGADFYSLEVALQSNTGPDNGRTIRADISFPVFPGACTVYLQTAELNIPSEYRDFFTVGTVTGGVLSGGSVMQTLVVANFARLHVAGIAGIGSASIIGKVTV